MKLFRDPLQVLQLRNRALIRHVAGVQRGRGFEEHDPAFLFGNRTVLGTARHHDELALFNPFVTLAAVLLFELHLEAALHHEEHLVFVIVMMPDERRVELHQLHHLPVKLGGDARLVVIGKAGKLFGEIDFLDNGFWHSLRIFNPHEKSQIFTG
jgi:hypothetical protein